MDNIGKEIWKNHIKNNLLLSTLKQLHRKFKYKLSATQLLFTSKKSVSSSGN
jgi:hypothetical protein